MSWYRPDDPHPTVLAVDIDDEETRMSMQLRRGSCVSSAVMDMSAERGTILLMTS